MLVVASCWGAPRVHQQPPLQKKNDFDDRGAFIMFQQLIHSWVGYKHVKVLLNFGLSPKIWQDLEDWSPELFKIIDCLFGFECIESVPYKNDHMN